MLDKCSYDPVCELALFPCIKAHTKKQRLRGPQWVSPGAENALSISGSGLCLLAVKGIKAVRAILGLLMLVSCDSDTVHRGVCGIHEAAVPAVSEKEMSKCTWATIKKIILYAFESLDSILNIADLVFCSFVLCLPSSCVCMCVSVWLLVLPTYFTILLLPWVWNKSFFVVFLSRLARHILLTFLIQGNLAPLRKREELEAVSASWPVCEKPALLWTLKSHLWTEQSWLWGLLCKTRLPRQQGYQVERQTTELREGQFPHRSFGTLQGFCVKIILCRSHSSRNAGRASRTLEDTDFT